MMQLDRFTLQKWEGKMKLLFQLCKDISISDTKSVFTSCKTFRHFSSFNPGNNIMQRITSSKPAIFSKSECYQPPFVS